MRVCLHELSVVVMLSNAGRYSDGPVGLSYLHSHQVSSVDCSLTGSWLKKRKALTLTEGQRLGGLNRKIPSLNRRILIKYASFSNLTCARHSHTDIFYIHRSIR